MVIKPVLPAATPELGETPSLRTLPFRQDKSNFVELLKAATTERSSPPSKPASVQVQSGDSLWRICENALKSNGGSVSNSDINAAVHRVAAANNLRDADMLAVGQKLDISSLQGVTAKAPPLLQSKADSFSDHAHALQAAANKQTIPAKTTTPDSLTSQTPFAALTRTSTPAIGGAPAVRRPLFQRLSNARPLLRLHPAASSAPATTDSQPATKSVDLAALMQSILEPGSVALETPAAAGPWSKLLAGAGRFSSGFGMRKDPFTGKPQFHQGIDIAASSGTDIYPYMAGTVKFAGRDAGHGNVVVIEHPNGMETLYAHASETLVKAGDIVLKDTPIAKVGSTGRSTGPHLHFEVRQNNKAVNPLPFIRQDSLDVAKAL